MLDVRLIRPPPRPSALVLGEIDSEKPVLLERTPSASRATFSGATLRLWRSAHAAWRRLLTTGWGSSVYIRHQEGRGIGLLDKLHAYNLRTRGWTQLKRNVALGHPRQARTMGSAANPL